MKSHWCGRTGALSTTTIGAILIRDRWRCAYCGERVSRVSVHLDHVISRKDGGRSVAANLVTACADCNLSRGGRPVPKSCRAEVQRRLALPLDRERGRKLGDRMYPWAAARRGTDREGSKRRRAEAKRRIEAFDAAEVPF